MFIGARVAYNFSGLSRAGVVTKAAFDRCTVKLDNAVVIEASPERLQLINYWQTKKSPVEIGTFRAYPANTAADTIFKSKKAIIFGQSGIRAIWYWGNDTVFDNKLKEPNFLVTKSSRTYGYFQNKDNVLAVSAAKCHSMLEFAETIVHEQIHSMNLQVEGADYRAEGPHGAAFLRWIPIIKNKIGLNITIKGDAANDVTVHDDDTIVQELKVKPFVFLLAKTKTQWLGFLTDRDNLDSLYGELLSQANMQSWDEKLYAGISDLARVKTELASTNHGSLPRKLKPFSASLVGLLGKTCKPIAGYYPPPNI